MSEPLQFEWQWCRHCNRPTIICPACGNNCCNGGSGRNAQGGCDTCTTAHELMRQAYEKGVEPKREGLKEFGTPWQATVDERVEF